MSYLPISIPEAMRKINTTWFLPRVQRPYVWGSRYDNERYIYLLFDSLLRGYPIGGLIVWETSDAVPFREFMGDYLPDETAKLVDEGKWKQPKCLVYDGQQRLQTLFSCLQHRFDGKCLCVDVTYDLNMTAEQREEHDEAETPFKFFNSLVGPNDSRYVRMTDLFNRPHTPESKVAFRNEILGRSRLATDNATAIQIEVNVDKLWDVFANPDKMPLAYFPVSAGQEKIVNNIFQRLNTGGIPLSNADIFFFKVKESEAHFEEEVTAISKMIYASTRFRFSPNDVLQLLQYVFLGSTRVDFDRVGPGRISQFTNSFDEAKESIRRFFADFLHHDFGINDARIVPRRIALLPLILFCVRAETKFRRKYPSFSTECKAAMRKYFVVSQVNDWNIDIIARWCYDEIDEQIREAEQRRNQGKDLMFPYEQIAGHIRAKNRRPIDVRESNYSQYKWFALKVLMPDLSFIFADDMGGRFNPEIDHIFPKTPDNIRYQNKQYVADVDVIWNMQPIIGDMNIQKLNSAPQEFFRTHPELLKDYRYLPTSDIDDGLWSMERYQDFIARRKALMISALQDRFGISLLSDSPT